MTVRNLDEFNNQLRVLLNDEPAWNDILRYGRKMLSELVLNKDCMQKVLSDMVLDSSFVKSQLYCIDPNEIQIYRSPDNLFSIRAYVWDPNEVYPIHDHGAWGIIGTYLNEIKERKFTRVDDRSKENYAEVRQIGETILTPGKTTYVLPVDEGIHQMQALNNRTAISIHVYGEPRRKGFIRYFNLDNNSVENVYSPIFKKKLFAIKVLGSIKESWSEEVLSTAMNTSEHEFIRKACIDSINILRG